MLRRALHVVMGLSAGAALAIGCGGSSEGTGGGGAGTSSTTSATTSATGSTGSTGSTASTTGSGGATTTSSNTGGTSPMGGPFSSEGTSSYEAQTSIATAANGTVVAAFIAFFSDNTSSIGYAISKDYGETWAPPQYVASPGGRLASNPVVAADGQGRFYLAWLGFRASGPVDEHVYLSKLDAATGTFGAPVTASDDGTSTTRDFDKPSIAIDANDNVLLTWADFTTVGAAVLTFARSTDGATFTRSTIASGAAFGNLAYLCLDSSVGPAAPLYVVHLAQGATLALETSTDQGKTWTNSLIPAVNVVFQNPTCVAEDKNLWVAYASGMAAPSPGMNAPGDSVFVAASTNGGGVFGPPVSVTGAPSTTLYLFPQIARSSTGKLELVYYQGTDGQPAALTRAVSQGGATWTPSKIADAGTFTLDRSIASWLGDYLGVASSGSTFVSFTENTKNKAHIGFAKVASP